jgi:hypothetical protein
LYGIQYYGSGDFRLEYCSIHGRDNIGYTASEIRDKAWSSIMKVLMWALTHLSLILTIIRWRTLHGPVRPGSVIAETTVMCNKTTGVWNETPIGLCTLCG